MPNFVDGLLGPDLVAQVPCRCSRRDYSNTLVLFNRDGSVLKRLTDSWPVEHGVQINPQRLE